MFRRALTFSCINNSIRNVACKKQQKIQQLNHAVAPGFTATSKNNVFNINNQFNIKRYYATEGGSSSEEGGSVAMILSGCGYLDGTEITEAVSAMIHLSKRGYKVAFFAPDINQEETFDHTTKQLEKNEVRNIRTEAARITRQNVMRMEQYRPQMFDALVVPGGFGVAKNLSNYAENPKEMKVHPEVERAITSTWEASKPMALCCIAPILAARLIPGSYVTLGDSDPSHNTNAESYGSHAVTKNVHQVLVDQENKIVTTPAYMAKNPQPYEVYDGIVSMIDSVLELTASGGQKEGDSVDFGVLEELAIKQMGEEEFYKLKNKFYGTEAKSSEKITWQDLEAMESPEEEKTEQKS